MVSKVSIIIVNYNAGAYLKRCIECVIAQSFHDFDVIIIDNASTDNSLSELPIDSRIHIIKQESNLGFAAANNVAANYSQAPWIACLNPDAYPAKEWLQQLMFATIRFPKIPAFGSTQIRADEPSTLDGAGDVYHFTGIPYRGHYGSPLSKLPATGETFAPCAAAALYNRAVFMEIGGFDEDFFCYCEDVDLGFRLRLKGYQSLQIQEAVVYHVGSAITGLKSDFQMYHGVRNRIWLWVKNMPGILMLVSFPGFVGIHILLFGQAVSQKKGAVMARALRDALLGIKPVWQSRLRIQSTRSISSFTLAKAFTWSMLKLKHRQADIRPYEPNPKPKVTKIKIP